MNISHPPQPFSSPGAVPDLVAMASPALVAIDRDKALVFLCLAPGTQPVVVFTAASDGSSTPDQLGARDITPGPVYFEAIAQALGEPGPLQITGCGADAIPIVNGLLAWLETCRPTLAARIVTCSFDPDRFCSSNRLLTSARNYLANQAYAQRPVDPDFAQEATRVPFEPQRRSQTETERMAAPALFPRPTFAAR